MERVYVFAPVPGWNIADWGEVIDHTKLNPVERLAPIGYLAGWDYEPDRALDMTERVTAAGHVFKWFTRPVPSDDRMHVAALLCVGILTESAEAAHKLPDFAELFMFTGFHQLEPRGTIFPRAA